MYEGNKRDKPRKQLFIRPLLMTYRMDPDFLVGPGCPFLQLPAVYAPMTEEVKSGKKKKKSV